MAPNHPHKKLNRFYTRHDQPVARIEGIVQLFDGAQSDNAFRASSCENGMLSSVEASDIFTSFYTQWNVLEAVDEIPACAGMTAFVEMTVCPELGSFFCQFRAQYICLISPPARSCN
ncbi:hypothetical protein [Marinoscillum sp.]|uniref:hypothetical protein n=1 Tax=Marinoscillum sp. TaxID=2024838 RepID=UPI003BA9DB57